MLLLIISWLLLTQHDTSCLNNALFLLKIEVENKENEDRVS